jgi:hypothetical protein
MEPMKIVIDGTNIVLIQEFSEQFNPKKQIH